jgi:hypothetical protein
LNFVTHWRAACITIEQLDDNIQLAQRPVTTCRLEGQGAGAKRICGPQAGDLLETIVKIDLATRTFQYAIDEQPLLPITDILATMVVEAADGQTLLRWTLEGARLDEAQATMVQAAIADMYAAGAAGLERLAQG